MKSQGHVEIYRVAHDAATAELAEITAEFERLRIRKEHVERLIVALKPMVGDVASVAPGSSGLAPVAAQSSAVQVEESAEKPEVTEAAVDAQHEEAAQPLGVGADPFQRRSEHVLGIGAGIRDVRQYTRQF